MRSIRFLLALAVAAAFVSAAAPAHAQRAADLALDTSHVQAAPAPREIAPASPLLSASRELPSALRPSFETHHAAAGRPLSVAGHVGVGAAAGAVTGAAASLAMYALWSECRTTGNMCGLAVPFLVGAGAVSGGTVGLVVGLVRNR
jgi:hypothetical protein